MKVCSVCDDNDERDGLTFEKEYSCSVCDADICDDCATYLCEDHDSPD